MSKCTTTDIKKLRIKTGARIMDCKKALEDANGDFNKAKDLVAKKGLARAKEKASRETKAGIIAHYMHNNSQVAAMVEILCETDFVAQNKEFKQLAQNIAMQVVAMNPRNISELLKQEFVRETSNTIDDLLQALSGKIGEKMEIKRFVRYRVGE